MADAVQQVMDTMVPALRDLADKQIFNEREIKGLVNKRREVREVKLKLAAEA